MLGHLEAWLIVRVFAQKDPSPTPLVAPVQLPSGHQTTAPLRIYRNNPRVHGLDEASSPQVDVLTLEQKPEREFAVRIVIPSIQIDAPIIMGVESEQLKKGVGQVPGSTNSGQVGNMVLSAHNDIYGELFRYLDKRFPAMSSPFIPTDGLIPIS
jgi:sortase A